MSLSKERLTELNRMCACFRVELIELLHSIQTGHPGGSLSLVEILTILYFEKMNIDSNDPNNQFRDRLILSKGHAAPILYLELAHKGFFPIDELKTLRQLDSRLQGHPCRGKLSGVELSTGPLGLGLSAGLGMLLALQRQGNIKSKVYVLLGDGECQEGAIWEAALSANKYKAGNLIAILDNNGVQLDGTNDEIMPMGDIGVKFLAFGWRVLRCDGHDLDALSGTIDEARDSDDRPTIIIAKTIKGKGVPFMEDKSIWHGRPIDDKNFELAMVALKEAVK